MSRCGHRNSRCEIEIPVSINIGYPTSPRRFNDQRILARVRRRDDGPITINPLLRLYTRKRWLQEQAPFFFKDTGFQKATDTPIVALKTGSLIKVFDLFDISGIGNIGRRQVGSLKIRIGQIRLS